MKLFGFVLVSVVGLSGCATMDVSQCQSAEWFKVGQIDGQRGPSLAERGIVVAYSAGL